MRVVQIMSEFRGWTSVLLLHVYQLANAPYSPLSWTAAMFDLAITCAALALARESFEELTEFINGS